VKQALPPQAQGKPLEIWFQDEARIGQQGTLTRVWARRGTRPQAPRDRRYDWAYLFGAICPGKAKTAAIVVPCANMDTMNAHFAAIAKAVARDAHAIIVLDGAGWHTGRRLKLPANISLLPLPPYSPELNPVENVWQYLRHNQLANRIYENYDDIVEACCDAWQKLASRPSLIKTIGSRTWAKEVNA
jgi:transposase